MNKEILLTQLRQHRAFDATEAAHQERLIAFVATTPEPFSRSTLAGHVTGSAVPVSADGSALLLIWHLKLQRWLQPGGHCEPGTDTDVAATALRELLEETGTRAEDWTLEGEDPFDLDVHPIPEKGDEPAHFHHDVRFLFRARPDLEPAEGRWVALAEVAQLADHSLARLGKKRAK